MTITVPELGDLFYPELVVGPDALSSEQRSNLEAFFAAVALRRNFPVHTTVLWNALVWGFDLDTGTYREAPIDDLAVVKHATRVDAVPVGAFVKVPFGGIDASGLDEFWGEVIYKEGRALGIESPWVAPDLSGAPATIATDDAGRSFVLLREGLIIDFDAILEPNSHDFERQRERGRCIDFRHHVVVDAVYDVADGHHNHAELDDATYFAHWMASHHGTTLRQGRFGAGLSPDALSDDAVFLEALVSTLSSIEEIASGVSGCRSWRGYLFNDEAYCRRVADKESALGGGDLEHLARGLASIPKGDSVAYAGLGTRLDEEFGDDAELHGPGWATVICHQSTFTVDWLKQSAPEGVLPTPGGRVHLRIDDSWQAGGVWRAQALGHNPDPICVLPSDLALGLGYAEATGRPLEWPEVTQGGELEPDPEPFETAATEIGARVVLTGADVDNGRLRLPSDFADSVRETLLQRGQSQLVVRLTAEDYKVDHSDRSHWVSFQHGAIDRDFASNALIGIEWVWPFVDGLRAEVIWTRGMTAIDVTARLRFEPLVIGDVIFGWDCDGVRYARGAGLTPPLITTRAHTLRDLVLGVFRTKAHADADGQRRATMAQLSFAIYGPGASVAARRAIEVVVRTLLSEGILIEEPESAPQATSLYVWSPTLTPSTRVADRDTLTAYQEHMVRYVRAHEVGLHLRRISDRASTEREEHYRSEWEAAGQPWWLPTELPLGYTYVRKHVRGHQCPE